MKISSKTLRKLILTEIGNLISEQELAQGAKGRSAGEYGRPISAPEAVSELLWWRRKYGDDDRKLQHYLHGPCSKSSQEPAAMYTGTENCAKGKFPTIDSEGNPSGCGQYCDLYSKINSECAKWIDAGIKKSGLNWPKYFDARGNFSSQLPQKEVMELLCELARIGGAPEGKCAVCEPELVG